MYHAQSKDMYFIPSTNAKTNQNKNSCDRSSVRLSARASVKLVAPPVSLQLAKARRREKNWSPFSWRGGVYLEYSLQPRLVLALNR